MMTEINYKTVVRHKYASESFAEKNLPTIYDWKFNFQIDCQVNFKVVFFKMHCATANSSSILT